MKLQSMVVSAAAVLSLSFSAISFAGYSSANNYYPPERVHCTKTNNKLNCEGFNHSYLVEDTTTADFDDQDQVFAFSSGAAYYNQDKTQATIFFTYRDSNFKVVKLRSANTAIRPDFENGNWVKVQNDLYVCKAGYMHCPITSLPEVSR
jgi:hypothetical protein